MFIMLSCFKGFQEGELLLGRTLILEIRYTLCTNRKLPSLHEFESVPRSRSKASTYSYVEKSGAQPLLF